MTSGRDGCDNKHAQYHCLDLWAIPSEVLKLKEPERGRAIATLVHSSASPPKPNSHAHPARISLADEALAVTFLFTVLGGPLVVLGTIFGILLVGSFALRLSLVPVALLLAYHPLPSAFSPDFTEWFLTCRLTRALYKYFTYRLVWTDDALQRNQTAAPWIGAGPPHGVLPFANILSIPALNAVLNVKFVGAPASITFRTPFLRYLTLYPCVRVDKRSIASANALGICVGIVPDGIAGIFRQSLHREVVALKHRRGVARLALKTGAPVFPAYSFGNTAAFSSWWDPWGMMEFVSRRMRASIFLYWGRWGLPIPRRTQITMAFDSPIAVIQTDEPSNKEIDAVHSQILNSIRDCFETHRDAFGWGDKELVYE